MIRFETLKLSNLETIRPYFQKLRSRACDNTIGGTFMWRDFFKMEYAIYNKDTLVFKLLYFDNIIAFTVPVGDSVEECVRALDAYCGEQNIKLAFCMVEEDQMPLLMNLFSGKARLERDWVDYLYHADDLALLLGRKYNGQRNHINAFKKTGASYTFCEISRENINQIIAFNERLSEESKKESAIFQEEQKMTIEVLRKYDIYALLGGAIYLNEEVIAFSIGEIVGDTLFVHIEKANPAFRGAYQIMTNEFARYFAREGINYINREEDVGDEGLRRSKLSYHPCRFVKKYTVVKR
jgi:hypothetical protein